MKAASERGATQATPDRKFARLRDARRVWAIAAVNAAARCLVSLHDLISERFQEGDRVVYLGNYVGHGDAVQSTLCARSPRRATPSGGGVTTSSIWTPRSKGSDA
jgi:hypothetical protein